MAFGEGIILRENMVYVWERVNPTVCSIQANL